MKHRLRDKTTWRCSGKAHPFPFGLLGLFRVSPWPISQAKSHSWPHPKIPIARKVPRCHLPPAQLCHALRDSRRCPGGIYNSKSLFLLVMLPSPSWHAHRPVATRGLTRRGDGEGDAGVAATPGALQRDSWPCPLPVRPVPCQQHSPPGKTWAWKPPGCSPLKPSSEGAHPQTELKSAHFLPKSAPKDSDAPVPSALCLLSLPLLLTFFFFFLGGGIIFFFHQTLLHGE